MVLCLAVEEWIAAAAGGFTNFDKNLVIIININLKDPHED